MATIASDHVMPCNIGHSEEHNRREQAYIEEMKRRKKLYIVERLSHLNEEWVSERMTGRTLQQYYDDIATMVKEKTGRKLQTKERQVKNPKTGKVKTVNGSSPLRESVINIKESTTMEDVQRYAEACRERWGITAIQIHIHRDEGHWPTQGDERLWKPNLHAHIVWDWMNHETGKSWKLNAKDMEAMQTLVAECLAMERGKSKAETGREHLERNDFILQKQQQELAELEAEKESAMQVIVEKQQEGASLDKDIDAKRKRLNEESGSAIISGVANLFGKGKYGEIEKENQRLRERNGQVEKELAEIPGRIKEASDKERLRLQKMFADSVSKEVVKAIKPLQDEVVGLREETRKSKEKLREADSKLKWRNDVLLYLADFLKKTNELFAQAVKAIIDFARDSANRIRYSFTRDEARAIKSFMNELAGEDGNHHAVGNLLVNAADCEARLSNRELDNAFEEVDKVADGLYRRVISGGYGY